jgi:aspartate racemase
MTIESLDMATTLAARGAPGDKDSWEAFDRIFCNALDRLSTAGCDLAAIASVTPHSRITSITAASPIPVVSIVDAVARQVEIEAPKSVLVLGTSVTMQSTIFDPVIDPVGCSRISTTASQNSAFSELLDKYFYRGRSSDGRAELVSYVQNLTKNTGSTLTLLACTDLTPAFPEVGDKALFEAEGFRFLDATCAHVTAILEAAEQL